MLVHPTLPGDAGPSGRAPLRAAGEAVAALAAVSLVAAVVYFLYSRRFRTAEDTTAALSRIRGAFRLGLPVTYVLALVAMVAAGWLDAVGGAVERFRAGDRWPATP